MNSKLTRIAAVITVFALVAFNLFYKLGQIDIAEWGEASHIVAAVEMQKNDNYILTTYDNEPDYWNLKPPLSIWGTSAGIALLGHSIFAARFSAAMASFGSLLLVFAFARRHAGLKAALASTLLCLCSGDMLLKHGLRSADSDALFIFFIIAAFFSLSHMSSRGVCLAYLCLGCSFLCKSFHAAPFGLAIFVFTIYMAARKQIPPLTVIFAPFLFLAPVMPWAAARYAADGDKFFMAILFNDVIKRGSQTIEGHHEAVYYFARKLYSYFSVIYFTVIGLFIYNRIKKIETRLCTPITTLLLLWLCFPLALYTVAQSKLTWYIYPAVPAMALLLTVIPAKIFNKRQFNAAAIVILAFFIINQYDTIKEINSRSENRSPVIKAIEETGKNFASGDLYMDPGIGWKRHYLASVKLLTTLTPMKGGFDDFSRSKAEQRFFITANAETGEIIVLRTEERWNEQYWN